MVTAGLVSPLSLISFDERQHTVISDDLKLTSYDLRKIADALDALKTVTGVGVDTLTIGRYTVALSRTDDQRDGTTYRVRSITVTES